MRLDTFGWLRPDPLRCFRQHSDCSGKVTMYPDFFSNVIGHPQSFWTLLDAFGHVWTCPHLFEKAQTLGDAGPSLSAR